MNKENGSFFTPSKETGYRFGKTAKAVAAATLRFGSLVIGPGDDISAAVVAALHHDSQSDTQPAVLPRTVIESRSSHKESFIKSTGEATTQIVIWENKTVPQGTEKAKQEV